MKYYKLKKQVWVNRIDNHTIFCDHETENAYGFLRNVVDIHGQHKEIYVAKSICKVEDVETDKKQVDVYDGVEYIHNILHEVTLYIPKWFFGKNRLYITIEQLVSLNGFYDWEEVEMD